MDNRFELENVLRQLRSELQAAEKAAQREGLKFGVEGIDLELKVSLKAVEGTDAGIKFYVFHLGGSEKNESEQALTIKMKLKPEKSDGGPVQVAKKTAERPATPEGSGGRV
jgi:hypothetical protein